MSKSDIVKAEAARLGTKVVDLKMVNDTPLDTVSVNDLTTELIHRGIHTPYHLQNVPVAERMQIVELIVESLKADNLAATMDTLAVREKFVWPTEYHNIDTEA